MYKISTLSKSLVTGAVLSLALFSANTFAGPSPKSEKRIGKPGQSNIVEIALAVNGLNGEFSYLLGAVGCFTDEETGYNPVVDLLTGTDKLTLFAPTDAAFMALQGVLGVPEEDRAPEVTCLVDEVLETEGALLTILSYHLTEGRRFSNSVFNANNSKEIEMLAGGYITSTPSLSLIDGFPQVISPVAPLININASNGVIHVIDTVMLPFNPFAGEE
jgi:uncharacterized surface protein with fasciclin (FAS1) repeats